MRALKLLFGLVLLATMACPGFSTTEVPARRHESARVLENGRLRVEVMDPAAPEPYYRGNRFSPVANVLRATLDGHEFLFSPVQHDATKENGGLAMEFDLKEWPGGGPPGYAEAAEGGEFIKVGVGVLRRTGGEYGFYKPYEAVSYAPTEAAWAVDRATFRQVCPGANGYAYELEAEVRVGVATVEIVYRLRNTGTKPLATEQYAHNFFAFDDRPAGPGYAVIFPADIGVEYLKPVVLAQAGRTLFFEKPIPLKKSTNATVRFVEPEAPSAREPVVVRNAEAGLEVRASVSRPAAQIAVHAAAAYLCAEQFVRLQLAPGEQAEWTRRYEFVVAK